MGKTVAELEDMKVAHLITSRRVRHAIGVTYLDHLRMVLPALAVVFLLFTGYHLRFSPDPYALNLAMLAGAGFVAAVVTFAALHMGLIRTKFSHFGLVPVYLLFLAMVCSDVFLIGELTALYTALFIMLSLAVFVVSRVSYWPLMVITVAGYIAALVGVAGDTTHFALMGLGAFVLSALYFVSRTRLMRREMRLSIINSERDREMNDNRNARDRFLGTMSYELRTPLTGVLGMMDLLKSTQLVREQREYVEVAGKSAELLMAIINDVLDISRLKAGEMKLVEQVFRPDRVADGVVRLLGAQAAQKGISISFAQDGDIPDAVLGDVGRISQVLMNLVANAVKFTEVGGIDILLVAERRVDQVCFTWSVKDTGPGLTDDQIDKVFGRFNELDANVTTDSDGSGLGLALCAELMELLDGAMGVNSTVGEGSTFWFTVTLPLAEATELIEDADTLALPIFELPLNILVAEDNPINQMLIVKLLEKGPKWKISMVPNGRDAVSEAAKNDFDLILMDIQMPVMDGMEATRQIRGLKDEHKEVPIVALTANALAEDEASYREIGMDDFIAKPINSELFYAAIANAAKIKHSKSEPKDA